MGICPKSFLVTVEKSFVTKRNTGKQGQSSTRTLMKRSRRRAGGFEIVRRRNHEVRRKVRTLKKLVPSSSSSKGLDGLFRDTADYILALQMRIQLMQVMFNGLSSAPDDI
ncbi:hypothetical protein DCAR_0313973 [Daucus carota subsp. sativus]|uniref:BHLH domain-containing protein n=1 Tax=Daucus carota subsp. sativus TaxID=79200 RepID=A0A161WXX8_DAUCS|nr:hypothetical protein DCAR_0313973 [Daucus carota subsp. sativus]